MNDGSKNVENFVIESFKDYNARRYSRPWVCKMTATGTYDFSCRVGCYTGQDGQEGELVIFHPVNGQVYAFGQKDRRGNNTLIEFIKWDGSKFLVCNKLGKVKETNTGD